MKSRVLGTALFLLLTAGFALAQTGIPDLSHCEAWLVYDGPETPTLLVFPDGRGSHFDEAQLPDGAQVDATVVLVMRDMWDFPICCFPAEDTWLEAQDGGLVPCLGGTTADLNTDGDGMTHWATPLAAGGFSQAPLQVLINGEVINPGGLALSFNSPDFNGDLHVNLTDVQLFAADLTTGYTFRADLYRDGVLNLSDLGKLAAGMAAQCP